MSRGKSYQRLDFAAMGGDVNLDDLPRLLPGISQLATALLRSRACGEDPEHAALPASALIPFGLALADCRQLLTIGLIAVIPSPSERGQGEGGVKPSPSGRGQGEGARRTARRSISKPPRLGPRSLILLTDLGLARITKTAQSSLSLPPSVSPSLSPSISPSLPRSVSPRPARPLAPSQILPHYDIDLRELSVAGIIIIRLRLQARNLMAVLKGFQLAGWPPRVVKPLNGYPDASDPQHLADAVYGLNHHQSLIEFCTDGSAIRWQWRSTQNAQRHAYSANGSSVERSRKRR